MTETVARRRPPWLWLLLPLAAALALRLQGLLDMGVGGNDTIYYYTLAEYWLRGDFGFSVGQGVVVFRPVLLGMNALALLLFGHTDYAIKLGNVLLDGLNLLLLALLAWRLSRRAVVVLAASAVYALLPVAVWSARQELPHTASTFYVLLCLLLLVAGLARRGAAWPRLALSGLCLAAATLTHEELVLLAPVLALYVLLAARRAGLGAATGLRWLLAFLGLPAAAALLALVIQWGEISPRLAAVFSAEGFYPEVVGRFLWDALVGSMSTTAALLYAASVLYTLLALRGGGAAALRPHLRAAQFCLLVPAAFVAVYALFFDTLFSRGFLPLLPLLLIGIFTCVDLAARRHALVSTLACGVVAALLVVANVAAYSAFNIADRRFARSWAQPALPDAQSLARGYRAFLVDARYVPSYASHWGNVYRALRGSVDASNRLLILPSVAIYSPGRRPLQTDVYFGDDAVYRVDHHELSLQEVVQRFNIRWVLFTTGQSRAEARRLRRYLYNGRWAPAGRVDLGAAYGMGSYSAQGEFKQLQAFLAERGAVPVTAFPPGSYDARNARLWRLPDASESP